MNKTNSKADFHFVKGEKWYAEMTLLRKIILDCGLTEELKWGQPCYTLDTRNVLLIHTFKEYCAILFIKGALLKDAKHILVQQTKNVQAARQIRFTTVGEIIKMKAVLRAYIADAIKVEQSGLKVPMKKTTAFKTPKEFKKRLLELPALKTAFEALTPGRQRGYLLYFTDAKQPKTREARVEKYIPHILDGLGFDD